MKFDNSRFGSRRRLPVIGFLTGLSTIVFMASIAAWSGKPVFGEESQAQNRKAPELTGATRWINSAELTLAGERGKVVVVHFWTFACSNCQHNLPYYDRWRADFPENQVQIIGVHTPETAGEADLQNVAAQVKKRGITYPVAVDIDQAIWKAYENRFWPSIYLIDKQGRVRYRWDGELEYQNAGGDRTMRAKIKELVSEAK